MKYLSDQETMDELSAKHRETLAELQQSLERHRKASERAAYYRGNRDRRARTLEAEANREKHLIEAQLSKLREKKFRLEKLLGILHKAGFSESQFEPIAEKDATAREAADELETRSYSDSRND